MSNRRFSRKLVSTISLGTLILLGVLVWVNKWTIYDQWVSRGYNATKDSSEVLENLALTPQGELVYKASLTEVDDKDNFKERCPVQEYEEASVLGCYSNRKIYVLKVDEPKLAGVEEVTAAHELLHAKFERMSSGDKKEVESLLEELRKNVSDTEVNELVANYKENLGEGESLDNEMFAVYGTQLKDVGPRLEKIYGEYFKDRTSIVNKYLSYSSEFKKLETAIKDYDSKLAALKSQKEGLETEIDSLGAELNNDKLAIDRLQNGDSAEEYQRAAVAYNVKVEVYNAKVERIKEIIAQYNEMVEKRNSEALSAKSLADKLNANVEER